MRLSLTPHLATAPIRLSNAQSKYRGRGYTLVLCRENIDRLILKVECRHATPATLFLEILALTFVTTRKMQ